MTPGLFGGSGSSSAGDVADDGGTSSELGGVPPSCCCACLSVVELSDSPALSLGGADDGGVAGSLVDTCGDELLFGAGADGSASGASVDIGRSPPMGSSSTGVEASPEVGLQPTAATPTMTTDEIFLIIDTWSTPFFRRIVLMVVCSILYTVFDRWNPWGVADEGEGMCDNFRLRSQRARKSDPRTGDCQQIATCGVFQFT